MEMKMNLVLSCLIVLIVSPLIAATSRQSSASQDIEIDMFVARVNKPFVKSIKVISVEFYISDSASDEKYVYTPQSPDGDIIDCVLIGDQPSLDSPLLKNHTIRMRPSNYEEEASENGNNAMENFQLRHQNGSCPRGTIPIRRTRKEDVLRAGSVKAYMRKVSNYDDSPVEVSREYALARELGVFHGVKGHLNIWRPYVSESSYFSLTQIWVTAGRTRQNVLEAGWQVYPKRYGDHHPRLFIFYTNNSYETGCYNLDCPGFVQIDNRITIGGTIYGDQKNKLGEALPNVSTYKGKQFAIAIEIFMDPFTDDWWLKVDNVTVGYWQARFIPLLRDGAEIIDWGGEVADANDKGLHTDTGMGSGNFPEAGGFGISSYIRNMMVKYDYLKWEPPRDLEVLATAPKCYRIRTSTGPNWGRYVYYGGPGKYSSGCP